MKPMPQNLMFGIILILFLLNVSSLFFFLKKGNKDDNDNADFLRGEILLLSRNLKAVREEIIDLKNEMLEIRELSISSEDELQKYLKQGNDIGEIAKKMNKSVKEVELILKMRGKL